jgi:hypothetical protein
VSVEYRFPFAHENLGPAGDRTDPGQVLRERNALANNIRRTDGRIVAKPDRRRRRPKAIVNTEATGHPRHELAHYGKPISSTKTLGRANIVRYLRDGLEGPPADWVDHKATWPKINDPSKVHPARATLVKHLYHGPSVIGGHAPQAPRRGGPNPLPERTNKALEDARDEWVAITVAIIRNIPWAVWLGDPNGLLPRVRAQLADQRIRVTISPDPTDAVLVRGFTLDGALTPDTVNGVPMLTDHRKALLGRAVRRITA